MAKIRVLIIDDSVVIRRLVTMYLTSDPAIEVVGTAADGSIGLAKISHLNPDLIVLDIEMPVMDGLQTLIEIRRLYKKLPVIMFSTLTERGAAITLEALALGANDYATKSITAGTARQHICEELIPKIKALCQGMVTPSVSSQIHSVLKSAAVFPGTSAKHAPIGILAIGVSTGGPNALAALIPELSRDFPVPVVIVQHMPPMFTRMLAERLATMSGFPIREGKAGEQVRPGEMWVAPGGLHMEVEKIADAVRLRTHDEPPENSCRPAVDVLFRSVAQVYGPRALAVVLTGMGQDGLRGCELIRESGGRVLAQDEASSVVWGMPGAVCKAGLAEKVLPLQELAPEINRLVSPGPRRVEKPSLAISLTKMLGVGAP